MCGDGLELQQDGYSKPSYRAHPISNAIPVYTKISFDSPSKSMCTSDDPVTGDLRYVLMPDQEE